MTRYFLGLDLGRPSDHTALAVLRRTPMLDDAGEPRRDHNGDQVGRYDCLHLERFERGTPYPKVVEAVAERVADPRLGPAAGAARDRGAERPILAVDATGVGHSIIDLVLDAAMPAELRVMTVVHGAEVSQETWRGGRGFASAVGHKVPRVDLAATVQSCLQGGRLKVVPTLALAKTLQRELLAFQLKPPPTDPNAPPWREGADDDLVLAVALAAWLGDHVVTPVYRFL